MIIGHSAGDDVLRTVAFTLQKCARDTDTLARYDSEKFVFMLPQTNINFAATFAERLRVAVESYAWPMEAMTASFGVASFWLEEGGAELIASADGALYRAKASGRNRVICAAGLTFATKTASVDPSESPTSSA